MSADEKFGDELVLDEPPADEVSELVELEPEAAGVLEDEEEDGELADDEDDCATASVDSAKSTAAVMMLRVLGMEWRLWWLKKAAPCLGASAVPFAIPATPRGSGAA